GDGTYSERADQAQAGELLGNFIPVVHTLTGTFIWDLPDVHSSESALKTLGYLVNDWQLSGMWTGSTGAAYTAGVSYQGGATGDGRVALASQERRLRRGHRLSGTAHAAGPNPFHLLAMSLTRRQFRRLALAGLPASAFLARSESIFGAFLQSKPSSLIDGVQI